MFSAAELNRYQRQMILPQFGQAGQEKLKCSRVLIIGSGGLGSPVALYLAAAGVGHLGLVDGDVVDESNLHRQVLYTTSDIGQGKVECAANRLQQLNPYIALQRHPVRLDCSNAETILSNYDVVIDGSDNFATRYLVNDACVLLDKPLIYGSIYQFEGQTSVFHYQGGPCYRCLFPEPPPAHLAPSCAEAGVLGVLPAVIASIQATEALKVVTGIGTTLSGRLLHYNAAAMSFYEMKLKRNSGCPVCGDHPSITRLQGYQQLCSSPTRDQDGEISATELQRWLATGAVTLIDVREAFEREICAIAGSEHIPLQQLPERAEELRGRGGKLVVYCKTGGRSATAQQQLHQAGVGEVYSLAGGILAWAEQVEPNLRRY